MIQKLLETHNRKNGVVKNGNKESGVKLDELSKAILGEVSDFNQIQQTVGKRETEQQAAIRRINRLEEECRKNNTVIFRPEERK